MIQNVTGGTPPLPLRATSSDRDSLRWNGVEGRGFAFGKLKREPVTDTVQTDSASMQTSASPNVSSYSKPIQQQPLTEPDVDSPVQESDTNAVAVTKDGSVNITVTIGDSAGTGSNGTTHFEEGGTYTFSPSDHPGAKYRIVGLEGGNGVTNPHNIKGTIFLNGAEISLGDIKDKAGEFLKKRDEIASKAAKADDKPEKAARAGEITLDDLKAFGLLDTPDVGVLNIHDDRFDRTKFTDDQVLSLKVAATLSTQDPLNPIREDAEKGLGLKLGHFKDGADRYGNGLKLGHKSAPGILKHYA